MKYLFGKYHVATKDILKMMTAPFKGLVYSDKCINDKNTHRRKVGIKGKITTY